MSVHIKGAQIWQINVDKKDQLELDVIRVNLRPRITAVKFD